MEAGSPGHRGDMGPGRGGIKGPGQREGEPVRLSGEERGQHGHTRGLP